jgi:antitoxin component of MazEF toxin-antitoxin module
LRKFTFSIVTDGEATVDLDKGQTLVLRAETRMNTVELAKRIAGIIPEETGWGRASKCI